MKITRGLRMRRAYLWQYPDNAAGWRAPYVGGGADHGAQAAPGSLYLYNASSYSDVNVGARAGF